MTTSDDPPTSVPAYGRRARRSKDRVESVDIFIAEPDPEEASRIRTALGELHNRIEVATDPDEAADRLLKRGNFSSERRSPDLAIVDADMIGESCWGLVSEITSRDDYDSTVVVVVAGPDDDRDRSDQAKRAYDAGARWYVAKPIRRQALRRIVDDLEDMGFSVVRTGTPSSETETRENGGRS